MFSSSWRILSFSLLLFSLLCSPKGSSPLLAPLLKNCHSRTASLSLVCELSPFLRPCSDQNFKLLYFLAGLSGDFVHREPSSLPRVFGSLLLVGSLQSLQMRASRSLVACRACRCLVKVWVCVVHLLLLLFLQLWKDVLGDWDFCSHHFPLPNFAFLPCPV